MISKRLMERATPLIEQIAKGKSQTATFAYFVGKDISQEVWVICLQALEAYSSRCGELEHYLRVCVNNRLRNLRRDRYFRPGAEPGSPSFEKARVRINLVNALSLDGGDPQHSVTVFGTSCAPDPTSSIETADTAAFVRSHLTEGYRSDFDQLLDGRDLPRHRLVRLRKLVLKALQEEGLQ